MMSLLEVPKWRHQSMGERLRSLLESHLTSYHKSIWLFGSLKRKGLFGSLKRKEEINGPTYNAEFLVKSIFKWRAFRIYSNEGTIQTGTIELMLPLGPALN
jgi:hypothetical protein